MFDLRPFAHGQSAVDYKPAHRLEGLDSTHIHPSIMLTFTFFRGDLRTSLTLVVGEDDTLKPSDQCEHQSRDQCEHETKK
jgi:hypothetical protein